MKSTRRLITAFLLAVVLVLAISLVSPTPALADNTGWTNPANNAADTGGDGNGFETNPTYAYADGAPGFAYNENGAGDRHRYWDYNFVGLSGATIDGIEVRLDASQQTWGGYMNVELSWDGGSNWTGTKSSGAMTTSMATYTLGGAADDWGHIAGWTEAKLNTTNFRVRVTCIATGSFSSMRDFELDWVPVTVHYTPGPVLGDYGDAPEEAIAYPSTATMGQFPTCKTVGPAGYITHAPIGGTYFGATVDPELDGNAGACPVFAPAAYNQDECFKENPDAGLIFPQPYTIVGGVVQPCPVGPITLQPLGGTCQQAWWGSDVDIFVVNVLNPAFVNVLIDWDQDGMWGGSSPCPGDTGWHEASDNAPDTTDAGDNNGFEVDPANAYLDDGLYAISWDCDNGGSGNDTHFYYDYGFTDIPAGATITGIEVRADWYVDSGSGGDQDLNVELSWNAGGSWSNPRTDGSEPTSEHTVYLGGSSDTWGGHTWVPDDFTNGNFRVGVECNEHDSNQRDYFLDYIAVKVYYVNMAPEHVLVDFPIGPGGGALSGVSGGVLPFLIGPNSEYVWARFMISGAQVGGDWNGEGSFVNGETEDYLLEVTAGPEIDVTKSAPGSVEAGQTIHYSYTVTNGAYPGNITNVSLSDDTCTSPALSGGDDGDNVLEEGETWTYTCDYVTTRDDMIAGSVHNTVTATGTAPGPTPVQDTDEATVDVTAPTPATNPGLPPSCGMDIVLIMDGSGSIEPGMYNTMQSVFVAFVQDLIDETPTEFAVVEFAGLGEVCLGWSGDETTITDAINNRDVPSRHYPGSEYTNWEHALITAHGLFSSDRAGHPDLIVMASNGEPNRADADPNANVSESTAVAFAVLEANGIKSDDIRIVVMPLWGGTMANYEAISGTNVNPPGDVAITTDVVTANYSGGSSTYSGIISTLAGETCGTIIVEKQTDPGGLSTIFDFTDNIKLPSSFTLVDDGTETFTVLPGVYTVIEGELPVDWELTSIEFIDPTGNSTGDVDTATATINVADSETVTCTFNNDYEEGRIQKPERRRPPAEEAVGGEVFPVNKAAVLAPWIGLAVAALIGGIILIMRRRATTR